MVVIELSDENEKIKELKSNIGNAAEFMIASDLGIDKKNGMYKCPNAHNHTNFDKNPSMSWDPVRYTLHCFRCDTEIDVYKWLTEYKGYTSAEAIE
jgi:DNA primase